MKLTKIFSLLIAFSFIIFSCDDWGDASKSESINSANTEESGKENRNAQPVILGKQKENPFSVENMSRALDSLKQIASESNEAGVNLRSLEDVVIEATDLYVRFLPQDSIQDYTLRNDSSLKLMEFPLDYEIKQSGDYYKDSTVSSKFTWLYTTVKPGYSPPEGVRYEVLSELFIPENSPYYSEEILSDTTTTAALRSADGKVKLNQNTINALYATAFIMTGNGNELIHKKENELKTTSTVCIKRRIGFIKWTDCDTYYNPDGYIKVNTPNGDVGVKGVKVRMWRWFSIVDARTDASGYYYCNDRFNKLLIWNDLD